MKPGGQCWTQLFWCSEKPSSHTVSTGEEGSISHGNGGLKAPELSTQTPTVLSGPRSPQESFSLAISTSLSPRTPYSSSIPNLPSLNHTHY